MICSLAACTHHRPKILFAIYTFLLLQIKFDPFLDIRALNIELCRSVPLLHNYIQAFYRYKTAKYKVVYIGTSSLFTQIVKIRS